MRKTIIALSMILGSFGMSQSASAQQKIGYVNSEELLMMMPEYQAANKELEELANGYQETLVKMNTDFQAKYEDFAKNEKTMSETMKEVKGTELRKLDEQMNSFKQEAQEKIEAKKRKLLEPITTKAENAIKEVATANSISYVFDLASTGLIVFPPGDNILPLLKSKLNLKELPMPGAAPAATGARPAPKPAPKAPAPKK
jgi:outer membrane protein